MITFNDFGAGNYAVVVDPTKLIRVFPKIDHSARSDRIVLVEYTIGSVVELKFC